MSENQIANKPTSQDTSMMFEKSRFSQAPTTTVAAAEHASIVNITNKRNDKLLPAPAAATASAAAAAHSNQTANIFQNHTTISE